MRLWMGLSKKTQLPQISWLIIVFVPKTCHILVAHPPIVDQLLEDPLKQPQTPAAKVTTVKPPTWGVQSGGQSCYHLSASYSPLDMPSAGRTREVNYEQCHWVE